MAVEASHNKTKTHTNKLWSKNYEYGFNKFKLFVTLINKNNTFFFLKQFPRVVFSCIYLFVKSCLPSLVFIYLSKGTLVSSTKKTECHDITEMWLKVALNTINRVSSDLSGWCHISKRKNFNQIECWNDTIFFYTLYFHHCCISKTII